MTGVQTCALPICATAHVRVPPAALPWLAAGAVAIAGVGVFGLRGGLGAVLAVPLVVGLVRRVQVRDSTRLPVDVARQVPLVLDLLAAALRSGQPVVTAVSSVAPLAGEPLTAQLSGVAGLLRFGADPARAWASLRDPVVAPIARTAVRSAESGVRLARSFELLLLVAERGERARMLLAEGRERVIMLRR